MQKKEINIMLFVALMGTSALALAFALLFPVPYAKYFAYLLEISVILIFNINFLGLLLKFLTDYGSIKKQLKTPLKANVFPAVSIASSLIAIMLIKIGLPVAVNVDYLALFFWSLSLILSVFFIIVIPVNIKFRSTLNDVAGTWFIPPVGLFVLISAGSLVALKLSWLMPAIAFINFLLMGPAFVIYFLTLSIIYFKSKFDAVPAPNVLPTFTIVLAPVGVSIMAMLLTSKMLRVNDFMGISALFSQLTRIYSLIMFGYGLWVVFGLAFLYYRVISEKHSIPFSEAWWAFIFPVGAFILGSYQLYGTTGIAFIKAVDYALFVIMLIVWSLVLYKSLKINLRDLSFKLPFFTPVPKPFVQDETEENYDDSSESAFN